MNFLSLFAGIGGFDLGLERAGMTCVGQVEIDPFCLKVLEKHWPHVKRMGDIRNVRGDEFGPIDLICGGFPCQDISNAGQQAGITGERSGLWSEFARIIDVVRPRYVIVENVAALLIRGMGRVLGDLAACGYDAEWDCIPASAVGAPHMRDRVWILAYPDLCIWRNVSGIECVGEEQYVAGQRSTLLRSDTNGTGLERTHDDGKSSKRVYTSTSELCATIPHPASVGQSGPWESGKWVGKAKDGERKTNILESIRIERKWATEPDVGRVANGIPNRVDRLRGLGNAVIPQIVEFIGRQILLTTRPNVSNFAEYG